MSKYSATKTPTAVMEELVLKVQQLRKKNGISQLELANEFRLKNGAVIIAQAADAVSQWKSYAKDAGVTKESMDLIEKKMQGTLKL